MSVNCKERGTSYLKRQTGNHYKHSVHRRAKFEGPGNIWKMNFSVHWAPWGVWIHSFHFHSLFPIWKVETDENTSLGPLALRIPDGNQVPSLRGLHSGEVHQAERGADYFPSTSGLFAGMQGGKKCSLASSRLPVSSVQLPGLGEGSVAGERDFVVSDHWLAAIK